MKAKELFTIGYEGAELRDFLSTLGVCGISQVIDVRDVPNSRMRGYSKRALSAALADRGIAYLHLKELGDPKPGREALRRGDVIAFRRIYDRHLKEPGAQAALRIAANAAYDVVSCLLCFERAPEHCHRTVVASLLAKEAGFAIKHIGVNGNSARLRGIVHDGNWDRVPALR